MELRHDLPRLIEGLSAIAIGTRDRDLVPSCALAVGAVADGAGHLTVYVPEAIGAAIFRDVEENGRVAVVMEYIPTHRTVQVKGRCVEMRPARDDERAAVERSQAEFVELIGQIGAPAPAARRVRWPCRAITLAVDDVYEQTPGPRAGLPLEAAS